MVNTQICQQTEEKKAYRQKQKTSIKKKLKKI